MNQNKEINSVILWGLFFSIIPLFFFMFAKNLNISLNWGMLLILEIAYYFVVWFFIQSRDLMRNLFNVFVSLIFRFGEAILCGVLLWLIFSQNLGWSLKQTLVYYFPAVGLHIISTPWLLQSLLQAKRPASIFAKDSLIEADKIIAEKKEIVLTEELSLADSKLHLDEILDYVKNFPKVIAVILVDHDGLEVSKRCKENFSWEEWAPLALLFESVNLQTLARVGKDQIERLELFTPDLSISIHKIFQFTLMTISERSTDEILNVRIQQVCGRLKKIFSEKYTLENLIVQEEEHVSNITRT